MINNVTIILGSFWVGKSPQNVPRTLGEVWAQAGNANGKDMKSTVGFVNRGRRGEWKWEVNGGKAKRTSGK